MKIIMKKHEQDSRDAGAGFTLVEVLLVVVIIGILVAVVMPRLSGRGREAEISAARASIANISLALDMYEIDNGAYPPSLQALLTKTSEINWRGPYLRTDTLPVDPWGRQFNYSAKDNGFELRSAGPNGTMGDSDDVTN